METKKYIVDFTNVKYYLEMHAVIENRLIFPTITGVTGLHFGIAYQICVGIPYTLKLSE